MAQGFFKKNEKLMMTVLLLILAPSFAFTGIMTVVLQSGAGDGRYRVFGETLTNKEFGELNMELVNYKRIQLYRQNFNSPLIQDDLAAIGLALPGMRIGASENEVLRYSMLKRETRRMDVAVGEEELATEIRNAAKDLIAWHEAFENVSVPQIFAVYQEAQQRKATVRFAMDGYRSMLKSEDIGLDMSVKVFEDTLAKGLAVDKLLRTIGESATVSEKEIYEEYDEQRQLRVLQLVKVPASAFADEARLAAEKDTSYLETLFYDSPEKYTIPDRIQLEALKINLGNLNQNFQPTDEEIAARYERDKINLYLEESEFDPFADPDNNPQMYQPLDAVKSLVVTSLRNEYTETNQSKILEDALAEGKRRKDAGEPADYDLIDLVVPEHRLNVEIIMSEPFSEDEISTLPAKILNQPKLRSMFGSYDLLMEGDLSAEPVPLTSGNYVYRIATRTPARTQSFTEARDEVIEDGTKAKSAELAVAYLQGWVDEITPEGSDKTLASLAQEANYSVLTLPAAARTDTAKLEVDGERLTAAREILQSGFAIAEPGELGQPFAAADGTEAYLVRLEATEKPDSKDFVAQRDRLEQQALRRKQLETQQAFILDLFDRGQPQPLRKNVDGV